jgi:hypothetical protein
METPRLVAQVLCVLSGVIWADATFALARIGHRGDQLFLPQRAAAIVAVATGVPLGRSLHRDSPCMVAPG